MSKEILKTILQSNDEVSVEFEVLQQDNLSTLSDKDNAWLDYDINQLNTKMAKLDKDIDVFTNDADKLDNALAVASGLFCGLIDSFFIGTFSFKEGMKITNERMEQKIIELAKKHGWDGIKKGKRKGQYALDKAIGFLEKKFKIPSDALEHTFGGARQHHLRDFAHHHSPIGLFFSILTQFTGRAYGTDTNGFLISVEVPQEMIGTDLKKKWAIAITDWALHLASDMHGSSASAGAGAGIPGPILSLLKAISALPIWDTSPHIPGAPPNPNSLSLLVAKLYNGTFFGQRDENGKLIPVKIDLRGEKAIWQQMGKQSLPVVINEIIVRVFYFVRRLYNALKENEIHSWDDITKLNWRKIVPVYNRTINHMLVVASGTFVAVDLADAAIRSAIKSEGSWEKFTAEMLLRINYPGIGRFVVALGVEGHMEFRRSKMRTERMALMTELLLANNIRVFNEQKNMWVSGKEAEDTINELYEMSEKYDPFIVACFEGNENDYDHMGGYSEGIEENNPWILKKIGIK